MYQYPTSPKPSYSYDKGSEFRTLINEYGSGKEGRSSLMRFPKHLFTCIYRNIILSDRNILHDFYRQVLGAGNSFWYVDFQSRKWLDEYVGRGGPHDLIGCFRYHFSSDYTNELVASQNDTVDDMDLFDDSPMVNDCVYFGSLTQFDKLSIILSTGGVGTWTITWEYWNGAAWTALADVTDGTNHFQEGSGGSYPELLDDEWDMSDSDEADMAANLRLLFERDVTFTVPSDWVINSVNGISAYWIRARLSSLTSYTTLPLGAQARINSRTYEIRGVGCTSVTIYVDGVTQTAGGVDYTFVSGGGAAGADRITFIDYLEAGSLITADYTGQLRIKGRLKEDAFQESQVESQPTNPLFNCKLDTKEVQ